MQSMEGKFFVFDLLISSVIYINFTHLLALALSCFIWYNYLVYEIFKRILFNQNNKGQLHTLVTFYNNMEKSFIDTNSKDVIEEESSPVFSFCGIGHKETSFCSG